MTKSVLLKTPIRRSLSLPSDSLFRGASEVVEKLRQEGYDAYLVGGSIRDLVMERSVSDCDIATNALPKVIQKLFKRTIPVGIQFGTIIVLHGQHEYEVTTFRADGNYEDGRRPTSVSFSTHITEDLERRDLTINGLVYDPISQEVVDYTRGLEDIAQRCIRTIGLATDRFGEDRLRMLRAVRFAARLGFYLESSTAQAIRELAPHILEVSVERIQQELLKMLNTHPLSSTKQLFSSGLMDIIIPENQGLQERVTRLMEAHVQEGSWTMPSALAVLLAYIPHKRIEFLLKDFRFSNGLVSEVSAILGQQKSLAHYPTASRAGKKRFLRQAHIEKILEVGQAHVVCGELDPEILNEAKQGLIDWNAEVLSPAKLLTGDDLKQMNVPPGRIYKEILSALEEAQLEETLLTRPQAEQWLHKSYPQLFQS